MTPLLIAGAWHLRAPCVADVPVSVLTLMVAEMLFEFERFLTSIHLAHVAPLISVDLLVFAETGGVTELMIYKQAQDITSHHITCHAIPCHTMPCQLIPHHLIPSHRIASSARA